MLTTLSKITRKSIAKLHYEKPYFFFRQKKIHLDKWFCISHFFVYLFPFFFLVCLWCFSLCVSVCVGLAWQTVLSLQPPIPTSQENWKRKTTLISTALTSNTFFTFFNYFSFTDIWLDLWTMPWNNTVQLYQISLWSNYHSNDYVVCDHSVEQSYFQQSLLNKQTNLV